MEPPDAAAASAPAVSAPLGTVLLLGSLMAFGPLSIDTYLPAFPNIARTFSADAAAVQRTLSAYFFGLAVGQVLYGPLADRFGRRLPLLGGITLYVIAALGCATAPSVGALTGWRFVQALGGSAGMVITRAVVRDRYPPREMARIFSQLMLVMGVAPILAPLIGSTLLGLTGWRGIFFALATFGIVCGLALALRLDESLPVERRMRAGAGVIVRTYVDLLRDPRFLAPVLGAGFLWSTMFVYIGGAPFLYMERFHLAPSVFGVLFALNAAGMIGSAQINARQLRVHAPGTLLRFGAVLVTAGGAGVLLALLLDVGGLPLVALSLFVMLSGLGFVGGNASAAALAPFPHVAGSASALMGTVQFAIGATAGAVASALFDGTGVTTAVVITTVALLGGAIVVRARVGDR